MVGVLYRIRHVDPSRYLAAYGSGNNGKAVTRPFRNGRSQEWLAHNYDDNTLTFHQFYDVDQGLLSASRDPFCAEPNHCNVHTLTGFSAFFYDERLVHWNLWNT